MEANLFTINTSTLSTTVNGVRTNGIVISTVHPATLQDAVTEMNKREAGREKVCFVNITPEQAKQVEPAVIALGRALYPPKQAGKSYLLGLPKREPVSDSTVLSAFGIAR